MPKYEIRIPIDPSSQPPPTATNDQLSRTNNASPFDTQITTRGLIKGVVAIGALKSIGTTLLGTVGDLTGSGRFERKLGITKQLAGYAVNIGFFGVGGVLLTATDIVIEQIGEFVENRNANIDSRYQASLSGRRIGNR